MLLLAHHVLGTEVLANEKAETLGLEWGA